MSILNGLLDKFKKEVVDKVADAIKNEAEAAKPSEEFPVGTVLPGNIPNGYVIGGGGNAPYQAPAQEDSWYDVVPEEECQYNFNGPFLAYFKKIFREDFPGYLVAEETISEGRRYKFTLSKDCADKLVIELMSENSAANSLRKQCLANGTPYLRFYFDHEGWWNTRKYVVDRVKKALGE